MPAMLRELKIELRVYDATGRERSYAQTWAAPEPITLVTALTDVVAGFRAEVKITDPLKPEPSDG